MSGLSLGSEDFCVSRIIARNLSELDLASLRKTCHNLNENLENEGLWEEKCRKKFPQIPKPRDICWRMHYERCYVPTLPTHVAYREGYQHGEKVAPKVGAFVGRLSVIPLSLGPSLGLAILGSTLYFLNRALNRPLSPGQLLLVGLGLGIFVFYHTANKTADLFFSAERKGYHLGAKPSVKSTFGKFFGSLSYYKKRL